MAAGLRVDWVGFILVALALGFLEIVRDKGQEATGSSRRSSSLARSCPACRFSRLPWELSRDDPIVDISLIGRRKLGTLFFIMMAVGAILFGLTQLMPQLLQENFGYTATLAGLALMPGCSRP